MSMRRLAAVAALLAALSACNTVEGVGEDLQDAARTMRTTF
jgi:predicted small secreted protein